MCQKFNLSNPFEDGPGVINRYAPDHKLKSQVISIGVHFDIQDKSLKCTVTHHFTLSSPLSRGVRSIDLNGVSFSELQVDGADFDYDGQLIKLRWNQPFEGDEVRKVTLRYQVRNPVSGMFFSNKLDGEDRPVFAITDHETECARYWLACVDYPSARSKLNFALTAPAELISMANGKFVKEDLSSDGRKKTTYWSLEHLCPSYLVCIAVGDFEEVDGGQVDGMPIKYFAPKGLYTPQDIARSFDKTPSMVKWLSNKLAYKFPWPKYYQVAAHSIGGAMENISLVTWSDRFMMDELMAKERKHAMDTVNIHEMAHTYFGDLLVIRHFEHVWLKESWATYMESVWIQDHLTEDDFRYEMWINLQDYIAETESYKRPMVNRKFESSWSMFDHHTYPGGACRIHMLRKLVGEQAFWTGVRNYVAEFAGKVVETEDFRKHLEATSGLNLTQFFDQWFYSKGFPSVKASYEYDADSTFVKLTLEQTQVDDKAGIPLFCIDVPIKVVCEDGSFYNAVASFTDDNKVHATVKLQSSAKPSYVSIDLQNDLIMTLDFNPGQTLLLNAIEKSPDVSVRIRAYHQLIKNLNPSSCDSLLRCILQEKFYGVRVQAAKFLADNGTSLAISILVQMLQTEQHPVALWQIVKACKIKHPQIRLALLHVLRRQGIGYRAQEFAYENLGYQCNKEDLQLLLSVAQSDALRGQHNFVRGGVLRGLGHHRSSEAFDFLYKTVCEPNESLKQPFRYARPNAIVALAQATFWQDSEVKRRDVIQILESAVVQDPVDDCKEAAISGLSILKSSSSADTVRKYKLLSAHQEWPAIERKAKRLEASSGGSVDKKLSEKIEKLEAALQKLSDEVKSYKPAEPKTQ
ncbi:hypothetical protein MIR68_006267 [Amoeboaphelidium protococcarum]|nr:hypothetical protein MIR68_006267 [Amoeboaphelidium protococcarum]